ncbi:MAG: sialate O-acetylesterase [Dehalococcoidia bacterium]|jgi:hypothetical protein|nr:sialate O-acetylesterase [Dehalococcoidia bacterium]
MKALSWSRPLGVVAALLLSASASAQNAEPIVFVLAGQSNMVGQGVIAELSADERVGPTNATLHLETGEVGLFDGERFGPEVTLARRLADALPARELIFVKHARGGTSLLAWAPEWSEARAEITGNAAAGPMYQQLLELIDALGFREGVEFGAIFWMQGERDALFPGPAAEYFDNLRTLVTAFRRDLTDPDLPFVFGLANPSPERYTELAVVQTAQRHAAAEIAGVHLVDTAGLTKHDDGVHYDAGGILELGRRFAETYLAVR